MNNQESEPAVLVVLETPKGKILEPTFDELFNEAHNGCRLTLHIIEKKEGH